MNLSKEKQALLELTDEEIRQVMLFARIVRSMEHQEKEKKEKKTDAYAQLQELIGLDEVKKTVDKILAMQRFCKIAQMRGRKIERPALHMQMIGAPGTGKTIVARLLAQIFKEYGICSKGTFIEAGRADLISEHVGGTAPKTREICRRAKGGVLFIDEAYGFMDEGNSYMGEFVSTLIAEMENNRNDLIVVFAGYEQEMREFMASNPGLKSRTSLALKFPDYSTAEMLAITKHISHQKGFDIAESAEEYLQKTFAEAAKESNFGNARFSRNLVEQAIMNKAERIQYSDSLRMSDEELFSLDESNFPSLSKKTDCTVHRIGFAV